MWALHKMYLMNAEEQTQREEDVPKAAEAAVCTTAGWGSRPGPAHSERAQPGCQSGPGRDAASEPLQNFSMGIQ